MSELKIYLLGAPRIEINGQPARTDRRKAVALLAYLATTGIAHTRETLATLFWPDADQSRAYAYLRRTIWEINNMLGKGWLVSDREYVALPLHGACRFDVVDFETRLSESRATKVESDRLSLLSEAVRLYRDHFMTGFTLRDSPGFDEWQLLVGERLRSDLAWALKTLTRAFIQNKDFETAADYGRRWIEFDPLHEPAHREMIRIYALQGQRSAALRQYELCVAILEEELGVSPEQQTVTLYEHLVEGKWPDGVRPSEPTQDMAVVPFRRLPVEPTPFVGRRDELTAILDLLIDFECHLLTLVGPGGSGKTRLSIQAASRLAERQNGPFPDGVSFISLAPLSSSDSIVQAVASGLNFSFLKDEENQQQQLIDFLRQKQMLLIMDNFEHLLDEQSAHLLSDLMAGAPKVTFLVTSRTRLNIRGEHLFPVMGMKTPQVGEVNGWMNLVEEASEFSAVQLFLQCARRVRADFTLKPVNITAIVCICRLVEGMPLGIELAASWLAVLSPEEIAEEINRSLDFLQTEIQDIPERQKSIRAVFESSWRMLSEHEQRVLRYLSIFRGGFSYEAAHNVGGASLTNLLSLINKSWLYRDPGGGYQMHELLRQYVFERLQARSNEWHQTRDRHSVYYADFMDQQFMAMRGPGQKEAFSRVEQALENVRITWLWLLDQGKLNILINRILPGFFYFALVRFLGSEYQQLIDNTHSVVAAYRNDPANYKNWTIWQLFKINWQYTLFLWVAAPKNDIQRIWREVETYSDEPHVRLLYILLLDQYSWGHDLEGGIVHLQDFKSKLHMQGDHWSLGFVSYAIGFLLSGASQHGAARKVAGEALAIFEDIGDAYLQARTLHLLAHIGWAVGDYKNAEKDAVRAREIFEELDERAFIGEILYQLAEVFLQQGHFDRAFELFRERRQMLEEMGQLSMLAEGIHWDALHALRFAGLEKALQERQACLKLQRDLDFKAGVAWSHWEMGEIWRVGGDLETARQWYDNAMIMFQTQQLDMGIAFYHRAQADLALLAESFDEADFLFHEYLAWAAVAQNFWSVAYAYAGLGRTSLGQGLLGRARHYFIRSLRIAYEGGSRDLCMIPLTGLAGWLAATGEDEKAVELCAFVINQHLSWRETKALAQKVMDDAASRLSMDEIHASKVKAGNLEVKQVIEKFLVESYEPQE